MFVGMTDYEILCVFKKLLEKMGYKYVELTLSATSEGPWAKVLTCEALPKYGRPFKGEVNLFDLEMWGYE